MANPEAQKKENASRTARLRALIVLAALLLPPSSATAQPSLDLGQDERALLDEHSPIHVGPAPQGSVRVRAAE
jgi:hypothetical protein